MVRLLILGSAHSVSNESHRHTHLAFVGGQHGILIDCGVCPRSRLRTLGVGRDDISDVILTHFHPDHVAGFPLYLMELWRMGRKRPIHLYAIGDCLKRVQAMLELYGWRDWPGMFPVMFTRIQNKERASVFSYDEFSAIGSPVRHLVPAVGLRIDISHGPSVCYSSDTEPVEEMVRLARKTTLLIHEATGVGVGHSSAAQAASIGSRAEAQKLMLIHYDPEEDTEQLLQSAQMNFSGEVSMAADGLEINF
jgi:ribonuclease Z